MGFMFLSLIFQSIMPFPPFLRPSLPLSSDAPSIRRPPPPTFFVVSTKAPVDDWLKPVIAKLKAAKKDIDEGDTKGRPSQLTFHFYAGANAHVLSFSSLELMRGSPRYQLERCRLRPHLMGGPSFPRDQGDHSRHLDADQGETTVQHLSGINSAFTQEILVLQMVQNEGCLDLAADARHLHGA